MSAIIDNNLQPIRAYFKPGIKEVVMNKPGEVLIEDSKGKWTIKKDKNLNYTWFKSMAGIMASSTGQKFNSGTQILSFKLPEGHRVQIIHGIATKHKFLLSIRLFRGLIFDIDDYQISQEDKENIIKAVKNRHNLLISGGTGTGKTSFLNTLINNYVESDSRIITIEGVPELIIKSHKNLAPFYYQENQNNQGQESNETTDAANLLNAALRMRPDRIILGELRKENCFIFTRAINTGHEGSMATIHANSPKNAICAIKENVILNGDAVSGAIDILDQQLRRNIHGVIQLTRIEGGKVKGEFGAINQKNQSQ